MPLRDKTVYIAIINSVNLVNPYEKTKGDMKIQNHGYCAKGQCQRFQKFNWFKETFHLLNKRTCKVISEIYEDGFIENLRQNGFLIRCSLGYSVS